ncbi:hypothetical protein EV121DRAFT_272842 [Schizophyllum commune]
MSHDMNLNYASDTPPAGLAPATPPLTRSRDYRDSLIRHIPGLRSLLTRRSRASHDPVATNSPALDIIAHNTTAALTRTDEVLHAIEQTNGILVQGFERLAPTFPQLGTGFAGYDLNPDSLPPGLRPEPPEVVGQAAPSPISLPSNHSDDLLDEASSSPSDSSDSVASSISSEIPHIDDPRSQPRPRRGYVRGRDVMFETRFGWRIFRTPRRSAWTSGRRRRHYISLGDLFLSRSAGEGEWEDVPASVGEQQGTSTAQDADGGQQASSSRDVGGSSYLSSPHSSEESSPSDRPAHAATDAMAANSPRHYHQVEASEAASTDDHSEGLTPSPSSFSYDSEHSPRTSLLSGDISVPHSTPNVVPRSEAGQQQPSTSAENAPPSLATVDATSTSHDHAEPADGRISDRSDNHDGSDVGPGVAQAAADVELTCLWFEETKVQAGAFVDRNLLIRVGRRSQLRNPSAQPFTEGLSDVVDVCEASQLPLKEISLEVHASTVRGGESDGKDALIQTLLRLVPHLGNLTVASVKFHVDDGAIDSSNTAAQERQSIRMAMSRLRHVRLEGATTLTRLQIFPLEKLHILEILTEVTEATVEALPLLCSRLAVLVAGPVIPDDESGSDMPGLLGRAAQAQLATFPSVLRLISAHSLNRIRGEYYLRWNEWTYIECVFPSQHRCARCRTANQGESTICLTQLGAVDSKHSHARGRSHKHAFYLGMGDICMRNVEAIESGHGQRGPKWGPVNGPAQEEDSQTR